MMQRVGDRLFIIMHGGDEIVRQPYVEPTPQRLAALLDRHPYLRVSIAHLGSYMFWDDVEKHLVGRDVYFDLSYTFGEAPDDQIRRIIADHGVGRILWASDFPWQSQSVALAGLRALSLSEADETAILGGNFMAAVGERYERHARC